VQGGTNGTGATFAGGGGASTTGLYVFGTGSGSGIWAESTGSGNGIKGTSGTGKALGDAIVDSILTRASIAEPAAVPSYPLSLGSALGWIGALSRNKILQTSTTQSVRNDADSATIATATHTVAGGTHTRGEFS
jgi:hypothetical protein